MYDKRKIEDTLDAHSLSAREGQRWIKILRKAALAGRSGILDNYDIKSRTEVLSRGAGGDLTLKIDQASERRIYRSLVDDLGSDSFVFLSEEIGEVGTDKDDPRPIVVCDPLDGSHNAQVGVPLFSISLCVLGLSRNIRKGEPRFLDDVDVGLILNVPTGDEYRAIKTRGAFHNEEKITTRPPISPPGRPGRFPTIGIECGDLDTIKEALGELNSRNVYKLRVLGSAAISLCLLADTTFDGLLFIQPKGARTIDSPAGYLIAREAGRVFSVAGNERKKLGSVKIGFDSRVNIVGARNPETLARLSKLVNHLRI